MLHKKEVFEETELLKVCSDRITIVIPPNAELKPYEIPNPDNPKYSGVRLREGEIHLSDLQLHSFLSRLQGLP